ncbi:hypothetical protein AMECASPLE_036077 [Ameca splendens]|uniref:Uncharacterized protein n=1 Tax=Ameca splendens TaxID=208324 RepID=A0ABV0YIM2_9TELE
MVTLEELQRSIDQVGESDRTGGVSNSKQVWARILKDPQSLSESSYLSLNIPAKESQLQTDSAAESDSDKLDRGAEPAGGGEERSVERYVWCQDHTDSQQINASFPQLSAPAWKVSSSGSCCIQKLERR